MKKYVSIVTLVVSFVCILCVVPGVYGQTGAHAARWFIPTIVNRYPNDGLGAGDDKDVIKAINQIYKDNSFPVRLVQVGDAHTVAANDGGTNNWGGDNGTGGGTAGDGRLTDDEGWRGAKNVVQWGDSEVADPNRVKNKRGVKISFALRLTVGGRSTTPGFSYHCRPTIVVSLPRARDRANNERVPSRNLTGAQATAETVAHEIGHVLGDLSHAPDSGGSSGNGNFMATSNRRTGTAMTTSQKRKMLRNILKHGKCAAQWEKAEFGIKLEQLFGTGLDELKDQESSGLLPLQMSGIYDLYQIYLIALDESTQAQDDTANISAQIRVEGVLPEDEEIDALYSLGFDIDDNLTTGVDHGDRDGIDRIVFIEAEGDISQGTFQLTGWVYDTDSGTTEPLTAEITAETEYLFPDEDDDPIPVETSFFFKIPKILLNLSAVEVPVVVTAGDSGSTYDTTELVFDTAAWLHDPTLATFGTGVPTPGQPYPFEISGLEPNSLFTLYLDDDPVVTNALDGNGNFSGQFIFPAISNLEPHFLTAQDDTGEFAYNLTCPESGACCEPNQACTDDVTQGDCSGTGYTFFPGQACEQIEPCPFVPFPGEPIPTLSEWSLIIFTLLGLTFGAIFIRRRQSILAGVGGDGIQSTNGSRATLFVPSLYAKVLVATLALVAIGITIAIWWFGSLSATDIGGTLTSTVILAYIVHLWILSRRESKENSK
jgi:hypothetical protein